jgi:hypothetical protein
MENPVKSSKKVTLSLFVESLRKVTLEWFVVEKSFMVLGGIY